MRFLCVHSGKERKEKVNFSQMPFRRGTVQKFDLSLFI